MATGLFPLQDLKVVGVTARSPAELLNKR